MKAPWEYLENLDEVVYVVDMETNQLVYMNRFARDSFSVGEEKSYEGEDCFSVIKGVDHCCNFCKNQGLQEGEFRQVEYYNPILDVTLLSKLTVLSHEGRLYCMEVSIDLRQYRKKEKDKFEYESMVNECLIQTYSTTDPDESLQLMLEYLGKKLHCGQLDLYEVREDTAIYHINTWAPNGGTLRKRPFKGSFYASLGGKYEGFFYGKGIMFTDLEQLYRHAPELYYYLAPIQVETMLLIPVLNDQKVTGCLRVDNPPEEKRQEIMTVCQTLAHFVVPIVQRKNLIERLKNIGYHDQMTRALNRHALNEMMTQHQHEQSLGIVYCDVVGLKEVNDNLGHLCGDQLILKTYSILEEIFRKEHIYRIGGDEFLVVYFDISQEKFEELIGRLRGAIVVRGCEVSVGRVWAPQGEKDFLSLMRHAEDEMYTEKQEYYKNRELKPRSRQGVGVAELVNRQGGQESPLRAYLEHYHFDMDVFFDSVSTGGTKFYLYFGDIQQNMFYVTDHLKEEFDLEDNLVYGLMEKLQQRMHQEDRLLHQADLKSILEKKKDVHDIRYRIQNKAGEYIWMHCRGILKWNEERTQPIFFSGYMIGMRNEDEADTVTGMLTMSGAYKQVLGLCHQESQLMILCFTFNNFADVNRTCGREVGDKVLWQISCQLKKELGYSFYFVRVDGMRFLAISRKGVNPEEASKQIQRIVGEIYQSHGIYILYPCSMSVLYYPQDASNIQELMEAVILAIRAAKESGGQECVPFSSIQHQMVQMKNRMQMALNTSVSQGFAGMRIVIQPQVHAKTGKVFGGEVLLRWEDEHRTISPGEFIPLLERSGLIVPVGKWVAEQAIMVCHRTVKWIPDFKISFNMSYLQIIQDDFVSFLRETMERYGVEGNSILIELTETQQNSMPDQLEEFLKKCKDLGMLVALDDFGNAYSGLQMLLQYPVDVIKFDRTLFQEIKASKHKMDFMMTAIYACHRLGKKVCIEGVEYEEELEIVQQMKGDFIQGYYYSHPLELEEFFEAVERGGTLWMDQGEAMSPEAEERIK